MARKHIKKVTVIDDKSTPEARAERVKRLRNLANLSRKQMCEGSDININTLKGWEIARYGGLPRDGAEKIVIRVAREGVIATTDWLLYEIGTGPHLITNLHHAQQTAHSAPPDLQQDDEALITEELLLFRKHFKSTVSLLIADYAMEPIYKPREWVAGVKFYQEQMPRLIGQDCIVQLKNGRILLRNLQQGSKDGCYNLVSNNPQTTSQEAIIENVQPNYAAPVMRHYRKLKTS
jgi:transcriptional regulator with XRE-family HTH domain